MRNNNQYKGYRSSAAYNLSAFICGGMGLGLFIANKTDPSSPDFGFLPEYLGVLTGCGQLMSFYTWAINSNTKSLKNYVPEMLQQYSNLFGCQKTSKPTEENETTGLLTPGQPGAQ